MIDFFPQKEQIVDAVLEGVVNAQKDFFKWTNQQVWVSLAPEYMLNIYIGQALAKLNPMPQIWFEIGIEDLAISSQLEKKDKEKLYKEIQRNDYKREKIDIVLDDFHESIPKAIIEVKNGISEIGDHIKKDIIRVCQALQHAPNLQFGLFTAFANINKNISITERLNDMLNDMYKIKAKNLDIEKYFLISLKTTEIVTQDSDGWSCAAACFIIERRN